MNKALTGVIPALLTPFNNNLELDEQSLRRLIQFYIKQKVNGVYVGGSTGEAFLQSTQERQRVLQIVAEEGKDKLALIAHVGSINTIESEILAKTAANLNYDAISAVTPFYFPFTFDEHKQHYQSIINAANGLAMIVYNIPNLSGVKLTLTQINELLAMDNVIALKQTSGDLYQMEQIRRSNPNKIIYNGYDEIFLSGQMAGANGGIGSTYNVMPQRYLAILAAIEKNDITLAKQYQSQCNDVIDMLIKVGVFKGLKNILKHWGVIETAQCRKPFLPIATDSLLEVQSVAKQLENELQ